MQVQDRLEDPPVFPKPVSSEGRSLLKELQIRCSRSWNREARELATLLAGPHLKALIDSHDEIAQISENPRPEKTQPPKLFPNGMTGDAIRMVGVRKKPGEPLGLTVRMVV